MHVELFQNIHWVRVTASSTEVFLYTEFCSAGKCIYVQAQRDNEFYTDKYVLQRQNYFVFEIYLVGFSFCAGVTAPLGRQLEECAIV